MGQRLALSLSLLNYSIKLSYRTKAAKLDNKLVSHFYCSLSQGQVQYDEGLFDADSLVICIPPGFKQGLGDFYASHIKCLVEKARESQVKHIIFTSSVGVYSKSGIFDESSKLDLVTEKQKALFDAEQAVIRSGLKYKQVLRLAGLIGVNRHPGDFRVDLSSSNFNGVVNMVMIDDVVQAVTTLIKRPETPSSLYNVVAPHHPTKRSFYHFGRINRNKAEHSILNDQVGSPGKKVNGMLLEQETEFVYGHGNLFQAIIGCNRS